MPFAWPRPIPRVARVRCVGGRPLLLALSERTKTPFLVFFGAATSRFQGLNGAVKARSIARVRTLTNRLLRPAALGLSLQLLSAGCGWNPYGTGNQKVNFGGLAPTAVGDPVVSRSDSTIGFNHTRILRLIQEPSGYRYSQSADSGGGFHFINWDGSNMRRASDYLNAPSWSLDGQTIIFNRSGTIFSLDVKEGKFDSTTQKEYTLPWANYGPKFDPTKTKLAVFRTTFPDPGVYIWDSVTLELRHLTEGLYPDWSPDGSRLAYVGWLGQGSALMTILESGDSARVIVPGFDLIWSPTWSPDGATIAFYARSGNSASQLYTVGADGRGLKQITTEGGNFGLAWSPSGSEIVYVRHSFVDWSCTNGNYVNGTLWRVNPVTGERHQLTFNHDVQCFSSSVNRARPPMVAR